MNYIKIINPFIMSTKKITKYVVVIITILVASLLSDLVINYISKNFAAHSYKNVILEMVVTVIIYYPAFSLLEKFIKKASEEYIRTSKHATKSSYIGLIIGFLIAIIALFIGYAIIKHNMHPITDFKNLF